MSLPVIVTPDYECKLVSLPKPIKIRPYLVKEEKLLLMAQQGGDSTEIENAVKQIIRNCTNNMVNPDKLPTFDIEYLFLQLRAKSVNDIVETRFECQNMVTPEAVGDINVSPVKCGTLVPVTINLNDIKITIPEGHTNDVKLTDIIGVRLRYPTNETPTHDITKTIGACIGTIYNTVSGETWEPEPGPDLDDWVESLSLKQLDTIKVFFQTMPHLEYKFTFACPKCKYTEDVVLRGLADFFD